MISRGNSRREGGFTSSRVRSWKLRAFTQKELETVWAVQELLGALTIGGGSAWAVGGGGGVKGVKSALQATRNVQKQRQKKTRQVSCTS